jgi:predicted DNA-binding transcriptional regulator AlpA
MTRLEQEQRNLIDSISVGIMLGKSRDNVLRMCRQGKLPKPVKPVPTNKRWLAGDIETWLSLGRPSQEKFERYKAKQILDAEFLRD